MADVAHPTFTFTVNLGLFSTEQIGPNTNSKDVGLLHPTAHQDDTDHGRVEKANFQETRSTWLPGKLIGMNRNLKHGDSFTLTGEKGLYMRDMYGINFAPADRAYLDVT